MTSKFIVHDDPFADRTRPYWGERGDWPASWVDLPGRSLTDASVALFRLQFEVAKAATARVHVSADNRYRLFLDGHPLGRGPERGDPLHWNFESYELDLARGRHVLLAQTWWLGEKAPYAQMSIRPGFILGAEAPWTDVLSTGMASWEGCAFPGISFELSGLTWGTGAKEQIDGGLYPWGWEDGTVGEWRPVCAVAKGMAAATKNEIPPFWLLTPATLPPMREDPRHAGRLRHLAAGAAAQPVRASAHLAAEAQSWTGMLAGRGPVTVPAHTSRRAIVDLEDYCCAWPRLEVSGGKGARVRIHWAEGLFEPGKHCTDGPLDLSRAGKGHRNEIEGKNFVGAGDVFLPDGGAHRIFSTLWWAAGRYLEVLVETADVPLTIEALGIVETGYPFTIESAFTCDDPRLARVIPLATRVLQMCSHETYMDCPHYEQLMYVGDARLEILATYALTRDDRLPRKALACFDASRRLSGLTQSRYPSRVNQFIPPFSLWWVCMVHDYWLWRDDPAFVRTLMPGVRAVMESFRQLVGGNGLMSAPNGWNFIDWVKQPLWVWGMPKDGDRGVSSILNLQFALALARKAELEGDCGETLLARRDRDLATRLVRAVFAAFWDEGRGLVADDLEKTRFSEHAQCLALLSGLAPRGKARRVTAGLLGDLDLARTTIYFSHYLFETLYALGRGDRILERLDLWFELEANGFKTTPEEPEPSRSDCHAWGAHPLYHYFASLLGIRPVASGFSRVRIAPQLGPLKRVHGSLAHPRGVIDVNVALRDGRLTGRVTLPAGVTGQLVWDGHLRELTPGRQTL